MGSREDGERRLKTLHPGGGSGARGSAGPGLRSGMRPVSWRSTPTRTWSPRPEVNLSGKRAGGRTQTMGAVAGNWAPRSALRRRPWRRMGPSGELLHTDPTNADRVTGEHDLPEPPGSAPGETCPALPRLTNVIDTAMRAGRLDGAPGGQELGAGNARTLYAGVHAPDRGGGCRRSGRSRRGAALGGGPHPPPSGGDLRVGQGRGELPPLRDFTFTTTGVTPHHGGGFLRGRNGPCGLGHLKREGTSPGRLHSRVSPPGGTGAACAGAHHRGGCHPP